MRSKATTKTKKKLTREEEDVVIASMQRDQTVSTMQNIQINIKCKTENQKKFVNLIKDKEIIIANGLAGTGKTFLSCAEAIKLIKDPATKYRKIVIIKSVTTLEDESIGYLKGSMEEKMAPFMYSFMSNFQKLIGKANTEALHNSGSIEVLPIAYLRGMSIDNSIIIIDEAQNISIKNMRTILTRLGENSKMIFIGDSHQIDMKNKKESALDFICKHFEGIDQIGTIYFGREDIVRNPLIKVIEDKFDELEENGTYKIK